MSANRDRERVPAHLTWVEPGSPVSAASWLKAITDKAPPATRQNLCAEVLIENSDRVVEAPRQRLAALVGEEVIGQGDRRLDQAAGGEMRRIEPQIGDQLLAAFLGFGGEAVEDLARRAGEALAA